MSSYTSLAGYDYRLDQVNSSENILNLLLLVLFYVLPVFVLLLAIDCFSTVRITTVINKDKQKENKSLYTLYGCLLLFVFCVCLYFLYLLHKK